MSSRTVYIPCPVCGNSSMWENYTREYDREQGRFIETTTGIECWSHSCTKRRRKIEKRARRDARRIAAPEQDFATYTAALIDLQARRAREQARRR